MPPAWLLAVPVVMLAVSVLTALARLLGIGIVAFNRRDILA